MFVVAKERREFATQALALGRSLKLIGDQTPRWILTDMLDQPWERCFHHVVKSEGPWTNEEKISGLEVTDADAVLALDADMLAFKRLDAIFAWCKGKGLCLQGHWTDKGSWWGNSISEICSLLELDQIPRFNGGMIYYERNPDVQSLLSEVRANLKRDLGVKQSRNRHGAASEELALLFAVTRSGAFNLIPDEMNFQNTAQGCIGLPELDVTRGVCRYIARQHQVRLVEPHLLHAVYLRYDLAYWRQIRALERLDKFEARHASGYFPKSRKLRRSLEKRWLQSTGKL